LGSIVYGDEAIEPEIAKKKPPVEIEKKSSPEVLPSIEDKKRVRYYFMHPDNGESDKVNGKFLVCRSNGHTVTIPIENGILETEDCEVRNLLSKHGMIFTHEREVINE
jgi:hypothetical protein